MGAVRLFRPSGALSSFSFHSSLRFLTFSGVRSNSALFHPVRWRSPLKVVQLPPTWACESIGRTRGRARHTARNFDGLITNSLGGTTVYRALRRCQRLAQISKEPLTDESV